MLALVLCPPKSVMVTGFSGIREQNAYSASSKRQALAGVNSA